MSTEEDDRTEDSEEKPRPRKPAKAKAKSGAKAQVSKPSAAAAKRVVPSAPSIEEEAATRRKRRNLAIQVAFIAVSAVTVFGFVQAAQNDHMRSLCSATCSFGPTYAGRNLTVPDFTLPDLEGKPVSIADFRGKTVVLNFWASWCEPCREEMASIARLGLALEKRSDVVLLTISVDEDFTQARDTLSALFLADEELKKKVAPGTFPFKVLLDPELAVVNGLFGTSKYPETWVIDEKGFIRARFDGTRDWSSGRAWGVIDSVQRGPGCLADFDKAKPTGRFGWLCDSE